MKIMIVFSHYKDGQIVLENAIDTIWGTLPTTSELMMIKRRLREHCGYQDVTILNWFQVKED